MQEPRRPRAFGDWPRRPRALTRALVLALAVLTLSACGSSSAAKKPPTSSRIPHRTTSSTDPATTTTTTLPPGLVAGRVTAIGDSVMLDYKSDLEKDLPNAVVDAAVSRQWSAGIGEVQRLRSKDALGATVVIGLGTNGPISPGAFQAMMSALSGVRRIVFVTVHVDQPWQHAVNVTLRAAARDSNVVIADWAKLAKRHPSWFYADGTHLPIGGPGAQALAALVARAVDRPLAATTRHKSTARPKTTRR